MNKKTETLILQQPYIRDLCLASGLIYVPEFQLDGWMDGKGSVLRVFPCVAYETKTAGSPLVAKHQALICPGYTLRIGS